MAKFTPSPFISEIRKKIGGNVFTKVHAGPMARRKVSPLQPRTATQANVRAQFTSLAKAWSGTLTATQRAAWNQAALDVRRRDSLGQSHTLTGMQLYLSLNRNLQAIGQPAIATPPATLLAQFPGTLTLVATAGVAALSVDYTTDPDASNTYIIEATRQMSPGKTFIGKTYRQLKTAVAAGPTSFLTEYNAKFGTLIAGKQIAVRVRSVTNATGAAGTPSTGVVTVAP